MAPERGVLMPIARPRPRDGGGGGVTNGFGRLSQPCSPVTVPWQISGDERCAFGRQIPQPDFERVKADPACRFFHLTLQRPQVLGRTEAPIGRRRRGVGKTARAVASAWGGSRGRRLDNRSC